MALTSPSLWHQPFRDGETPAIPETPAAPLRGGNSRRWLIAHPGPDFSVADVYNGWAEALRGLGQQVAEFNLNDRLTFYSSVMLQDPGEYDDQGYPMFKRALKPDQAMILSQAGLIEDCYKWWPDVVLIISGHFVGPDVMQMMRGRGHKVVCIMTESPYEDEWQLSAAQHADVVLLNDPVNLDKFKAVCPVSYYQPHAYRPGLHKPGPADPRLVCDLAFAGTGFPSRVDFFHAMDLTDIDTVLAGCWLDLPEGSPLNAYLCTDKDECLDNHQVVDLYRSAKSGINIYRTDSQWDYDQSQVWAVGPREIEQAQCGLFYLRDPRGEGDELFPMLPTFDGPGDASEKLRWYLARPEIRERAAAEARAACADRTFTNSAKRLLRMLDRLPARV